VNVSEKFGMTLPHHSFTNILIHGIAVIEYLLFDGWSIIIIYFSPSIVQQSNAPSSPPSSLLLA
jgi:hypothetical protein